MKFHALIKISAISVTLTAFSSADHPTVSQPKPINSNTDLSLIESAQADDSKLAPQGKNLPDSVLVGTEVESLDHFKFGKIKSATLPGNYYAEIGGAELTLRITSSSDNQLSITRTYREPELELQTKVYQGVLWDANGLHKGNDLQGKAVKDGILLHEAASGVDGVPDTLWILYTKKN